MCQLCLNLLWHGAAPITMASIVRALPGSDAKKLCADRTISSPITLLKELIENSIDARATIVEVLVSSDTTSKIEVRDNGTGISPADYAHLGKTGHTSKITTFDDLNSFSGVSLGFRGQALALINSVARLSITTKTIDGITATELSFSSDGTIERKRSVAAPVGTTVTVTNFLKRRPVREKLARKEACKAIPKMKELMTGIALAHPQIRFSLKISNSQSPAWNYPANTTSALKNTIVTLFGVDLAGQCMEEKFSASVSDIPSDYDFLHMLKSSWNFKPDGTKTSSRVSSRASSRHDSIEFSSNLASEHTSIQTKDLPTTRKDCASLAGKDTSGARYTFEAFMAKPDADPSKIDKGIFISADSRPLSSARGTPKKLAVLYRDTLHKLFGTGTSTLREPFLRLNIKCPVGSYDPNVDSSKEEVIFASESDIVNLFSMFCEKVYDKTFQVKLDKEKNKTIGIKRHNHSECFGVNIFSSKEEVSLSIHQGIDTSGSKTSNFLLANKNSPSSIKRDSIPPVNGPTLLGKNTTLEEASGETRELRGVNNSDGREDNENKPRDHGDSTGTRAKDGISTAQMSLGSHGDDRGRSVGQDKNFSTGSNLRVAARLQSHGRSTEPEKNLGPQKVMVGSDNIQDRVNDQNIIYCLEGDTEHGYDYSTQHDGKFRPHTPQNGQEMHDGMERSICDHSALASRMPPSMTSISSPQYPSQKRKAQDSAARCMPQVHGPGGKSQSPTLSNRGKGLFKTLGNASGNQQRAQKRMSLPRAGLQTPPHSMQRPGPASKPPASFQPVSQAFRNAISSYLEETRSKRQREDVSIKQSEFQSVSSDNIRIEKRPKIRRLEYQPEQARRHMPYPFRPRFESPTIARGGLLKEPNAPLRPPRGVHGSRMPEDPPITRSQAQERDAQLEISESVHLRSPPMAQNLNAGVTETRVTGLAMQDNCSFLIKAQKVNEAGPLPPNVPARFVPLEKIPRSLWFRDINRNDGSVILNVEMLASFKALSSAWKLCLRDTYGAEEGEEFEESSIFSQLDCSKLQKKFDVMVDGYHRKLGLKNYLMVG